MKRRVVEIANSVTVTGLSVAGVYSFSPRLSFFAGAVGLIVLEHLIFGGADDRPS